MAMEKNTDKNVVMLKDDESVGKVQIADDVVAMIASLAATEVEGVTGTTGNITNELMNMVAKKGNTKGVKVEVLGHDVKVDLSITMDYGFNIPATAGQVQTKVKNAIESMTGLKCTDVNVRIAAVNMKKD